ncbi:MAG: hypothetical protein L3K05_02995 [Thermoplasmata archaeon]|nr:hypothetical protein [Thermoplasmata archaeon]
MSGSCVLQYPLVGRFLSDHPSTPVRPSRGVGVLHLPSSEISDKIGLLAEELGLGSQCITIPALERVKNPAVQAATLAALQRFSRIRAELALSPGVPEAGSLDHQAFRRVRDDLLPAWRSSLLDIDEDDSVRSEGRRLYDELQRVLARHYFMDEPWHYGITSLFILQAHLVLSLRRVFYLFRPGNAGTGKTEFDSRIAELTGGLVLVDFSASYLARNVTRGRTLLIDEYESRRDSERDGAVAALLRSGYKSDAPKYARSDRNGKNVEFDIFGPKVVSYRGALTDGALQGRGFVISSAKPTGVDGFEFVLMNTWPEFADLPARLKKWGERARLRFPERRLKEIAYSADFRRRLSDSVVEVGANRECEITMTALLVANIAGLDVRACLRAANEVRQISVADSEGDALAELADAIRSVRQSRAKSLDAGSGVTRFHQKDVKEELNRVRRSAGGIPLGTLDFSRLRDEIGIERRWLRKLSGNALAWNIPVEFLAQLDRQYPPRGTSDTSDGSALGRSPGTDASDPTYATRGVTPDPEDLLAGVNTRADLARLRTRESEL